MQGILLWIWTLGLLAAAVLIPLAALFSTEKAETADRWIAFAAGTIAAIAAALGIWKLMRARQ